MFLHTRPPPPRRARPPGDRSSAHRPSPGPRPPRSLHPRPIRRRGRGTLRERLALPPFQIAHDQRIPRFICVALARSLTAMAGGVSGRMARPRLSMIAMWNATPWAADHAIQVIPGMKSLQHSQRGGNADFVHVQRFVVPGQRGADHGAREFLGKRGTEGEQGCVWTLWILGRVEGRHAVWLVRVVRVDGTKCRLSGIKARIINRRDRVQVAVRRSGDEVVSCRGRIDGFLKVGLSPCPGARTSGYVRERTTAFGLGATIPFRAINRVIT